MGSTKVQVMDMSQEEELDLKKREKEFKRAEKAKQKDKVDIQEKIDAKIEDNEAKEAEAPVSAKRTRVRSKTYVAARSRVDKTKFYSLDQAIELIQSTSYSSFTGTIVADLVTKADKVQVEVAFPHSTGQSVTVAIATDALIKKIEKGDINFDILIASPDMMPKLAKHAKVLGPKGLMPNPKNKTVTDKPEARKKELEAGKVSLRTEKKAPLMHVVVGKTDMKAKDIQENIEVLIKMVGPKKIQKLTLNATMSPGVKVDLTEYQSA